VPAITQAPDLAFLEQWTVEHASGKA